MTDRRTERPADRSSGPSTEHRSAGTADAGQPEHIVLIGLMGAGKTSVGAAVGARMDRPMIDVDDVILERTGMTVRELWERGGEVTYRPLERDAVLNTLSGDGPDVLGAPAGAVMDPLVQEAFTAADTFTVFLQAEVSTLAGRVSPNDHRPLLGRDPVGTLRTMRQDRTATYLGLADLTLDVEGRTPEELAHAIVAALPTDGPHPADGTM